MAQLKPTPDPERRPAALIQSVDRAISLLELLAQHGRASITEIAGELGVHKSTASRLVSVLENRGLVEQLGDRGKYALGPGIARLAAAGTRRPRRRPEAAAEQVPEAPIGAFDVVTALPAAIRSVVS